MLKPLLKRIRDKFLKNINDRINGSNELLIEINKQNNYLLDKINLLEGKLSSFSQDKIDRVLLTNKRHCVSVVRVVFIIHSPEFWYSLLPVYKRMLCLDEFEPIVITTAGNLYGYGSSTNIADEYFNIQNIHHLNVDKERLHNVIDVLNPDVVFMQSHWEEQKHTMFRTLSLLGHRLCYIPYGIHTNPMDEMLYNRQLHNYAWRLYCVNDYHKLCYSKFNNIGSFNAVVSGYTKFEYINSAINKIDTNWPLTNSNDKLKILWATHHSVEGWLAFSTFHQNFRQILSFIKKNLATIQVVFRPHPKMFGEMVFHGKMLQSEVDFFIKDFSQLENCYLDEGAEYIHLFKQSDILVTDGVGFLFEYLLTGKPIIHTDSKVNCGFNDYYKQIEPAWYKAYEFDDVEKLIAQLRSGDDPLKHTRQELVKLLYPISDKEPSEIICDDIRKSILGK
ncbi:MAG: CDP-glycerol glycerophosphotransferase family protein [Sphingobacteriaceae bacterium]|nr:CDP-glycerol glycerophosphotransferase family protein [Sphingobacteriaceae bacterium]